MMNAVDTLIARHVEFGRDPEDAHQRSHGVDERNAEMIKATKKKRQPRCAARHIQPPIGERETAMTPQRVA